LKLTVKKICKNNKLQGFKGFLKAKGIVFEKTRRKMRTKSQTRNIPYLPEFSKGFDQRKHLLDVYPSAKENADVLIFIHGGGWSAGSKNLYQKLGENLAAKGITAVIINYRLAPEFNVLDMASDCAAALHWVFQNIGDYNGNRDRIFISGHSAGGHLAALIALNEEFTKYHSLQKPTKGLLLIDAFGLNALDFIQAHQSLYVQHITNIFTDNPETWRKASPAEFLHEVDFSILILTGSQTHDVLMYDNKIFAQKLKENDIKHQHRILPGKSHMQMILQLENPDNEIYKDLLDFINE
jgi:acetyl esterase/lipase